MNDIGHVPTARQRPIGDLFHRSLRRVRSSLQTRTIALVVLVSLAVAIVFSIVSMISVRSNLINQVTAQSRDDFSNQFTQAQSSLDSADVSSSTQYQQLVNDLASVLQRDGPSNLIGVYFFSRDTGAYAIIPVSTEPSYATLISDDMRTSVATGDVSVISYQPVSVPREDGRDSPGAVLGSLLESNSFADLEFFALYSYDSRQVSLTQIQLGLLAVCLMLSIMMGLLVWRVLRGITMPVERVASAAERLALGDLDSRVSVNRHDEIGTLQRAFNEMAGSLEQKIDELEQAGASQRRFVSDVSHELRTPVTTMRMASDLLSSRKEQFDPSTQRTVELLNEQIDRFQDMLIDLLEISRYDAGNSELDVVDSDVHDPVQSAVDQVRPLAWARHVSIELKFPKTRVVAAIDDRRITRIVRNLLINAIDFAQNQPVEVRLVANDKAVVISVLDHGAGMTPDQVAHVFDRFWRADASRSRSTGGSGLGLSIAEADANLHYGTIRLRSQKGHGSRFMVILPRKHEQTPISDDDLPIRFVPESKSLDVIVSEQPSSPAGETKECEGGQDE